MLKDVIREIIPLTPNDCFTIFSREKDELNFPLHNHDEMEINLVINVKGAKRIVADHINEIKDRELILVGLNLAIADLLIFALAKKIKEVAIQFYRDLVDEPFLKKNQLSHIRNMFENSKRRALFSHETYCGFNNIGNFNRAFKTKKACTL